MRSERDGINPAVEPSGTGCVKCLALGGWWFHLRRCAECGHIGCCDSSPNQHASKHHAATGHPIITSFEPGERWFYDYRTGQFVTGPQLSAPLRPAPAAHFLSIHNSTSIICMGATHGS
jgi:Zn-finger in ubiquitin-hydrolases and other protein